jgi:hypothetical protein
MFIRKVSPEFPNDILKRYIYEKYVEEDEILYSEFTKMEM